MRAAVVLLTRDLRVHDNPALAAAAREAEHVLPLFVRDERLLRVSAARAELVGAALGDLDGSLRRLGAALVVREGDPVAETVRAVRACRAEAVFCQADVSPFARRRERELAAALGPVPLRLVPGVAVVPPGEVAPAGGDHYRVFTPYHRAWSAAPRRAPDEPPRALRLPPGLEAGPAPAAAGGGETEARRRLDEWLEGGDAAYGRTRDALAVEGTSRLSAALHLGLLSPLEVVRRSRSPELVRQLAWRDFYQQLLWANPAAATADLRPRRRGWDDDPAALEAWRAGLTGYPVVDAGMRQLAATGWMHNRARMVVASFLTKHLNVDWRRGAEHFARLLVDGDVASNTGNWQWVAGTGVDSRPGRIFNPTLQGRRFDPDGEYVRRWVPELEAVPGGAVHEPWLLGPLLTGGYPAPVVEHAAAVARFRAG